MKARTPAFDALEPGDLAIVPEAALDLLDGGGGGGRRPGRTGARRRRLRAPAGRGPGEGSEAGPAAAAVAGEASAMGLPVLRLAGGDTERLERAVIGYLVNARAELDRQAGRPGGATSNGWP